MPLYKTEGWFGLLFKAGGGGIWGKKDQLRMYPADGTMDDAINLSGEWRYKVAAVKPPPALN
ncbi:MAG: hypothetical protein M3R50_03875, partial [Bacteroidota bacterium]|nr:hypothetical protein [Bacteroidota bacterium]